ncbi:MAG TPA: DUF2510 domain-containing protein [Acidimicrobiales bacterium]|nr:DUF2510 domain-containing protein [Acidimicrobiales bacterium]
MAPAGWYDNPENAAELRLWDGAAWTSETKPKAAPTPLPPPSVPLAGQGWSAQSGFGGPQQGPAQQSFGTPNNYGAPQAFTRSGPGPQGNMQSGWGSGTSFGAGPGTIRGVPVSFLQPGSLRAMAAGVILGLIVALVGFGALSKSGTPSGESATTTGTVSFVSYTRSGPHGGSACQPSARFTVGGSTFTASTPVAVSPCSWSIGQIVTVHYNPSNPAEASIPAGAIVGIVGVVFTVIGLLIAVVAVVATMRVRRQIAAGTYVQRARITVRGGLPVNIPRR